MSKRVRNRHIQIGDQGFRGVLYQWNETSSFVGGVERTVVWLCGWPGKRGRMDRRFCAMCVEFPLGMHF